MESLLKRILATPLPESAAETVSVAAVELVYATPPLIETVPVGAVVSRAMLCDRLSTLSAASRNWASTVLEPSPLVSVDDPDVA